jgi:hypothetical protein
MQDKLIFMETSFQSTHFNHHHEKTLEGWWSVIKKDCLPIKRCRKPSIPLYNKKYKWMLYKYSIENFECYWEVWKKHHDDQLAAIRNSINKTDQDLNNTQLCKNFLNEKTNAEVNKRKTSETLSTELVNGQSLHKKLEETKNTLQTLTTQKQAYIDKIKHMQGNLPCMSNFPECMICCNAISAYVQHVSTLCVTQQTCETAASHYKVILQQASSMSHQLFLVNLNDIFNAIKNTSTLLSEIMHQQKLYHTYFNHLTYHTTACQKLQEKLQKYEKNIAIWDKHSASVDYKRTKLIQRKNNLLEKLKKYCQQGISKDLAKTHLQQKFDFYTTLVHHFTEYHENCIHQQHIILEQFVILLHIIRCITRPSNVDELLCPLKTNIINYFEYLKKNQDSYKSLTTNAINLNHDINNWLQDFFNHSGLLIYVKEQAIIAPASYALSPLSKEWQKKLHSLKSYNKKIINDNTPWMIEQCTCIIISIQFSNLCDQPLLEGFTHALEHIIQVLTPAIDNVLLNICTVTPPTIALKPIPLRSDFFNVPSINNTNHESNDDCQPSRLSNNPHIYSP